MPAFITANLKPVAIYPGQSIVLINNAATDTGVTSTVQVAIGPDPMGQYRCNIVNTTNQTATVNVAPNDAILTTPASTSYEPYTDGATAVTVAGSKAVSFNCFGPWINCSFSTAPTSGSLILSR